MSITGDTLSIVDILMQSGKWDRQDAAEPLAPSSGVVALAERSRVEALKSSRETSRETGQSLDGSLRDDRKSTQWCDSADLRVALDSMRSKSPGYSLNQRETIDCHSSVLQALMQELRETINKLEQERITMKQVSAERQVVNGQPRTHGDIDCHSSVLQALMQQELQKLRESLVSEFQLSKEQFLAGYQELKILLEQASKSTEEKVLRQMPLLPEQPVTENEDFDEKEEAAQEDVQECEHEWDEFAKEVRNERQSTTDLYHEAMSRILKQKGFWPQLLGRCGIRLRLEPPDTWAARVVRHPAFHLLQGLMIMCNAVLMGYEADLSIKAALGDASEPPDWLEISSITLTIIFMLEVAFRIAATGTCFFVAPGEWAWNMFDVMVVAFGLLGDLADKHFQLGFLRALRIIRAIRVARLLRVVRFFAPLREMLLSMIACLSSLVWFFLFLFGFMYMISIFLLQGLAFDLRDRDHKSLYHHLDMESLEQVSTRDFLIKLYFDSVPNSMLTLLASVTGGTDWMSVYRATGSAGTWYRFTFLIFVLVVMFGVINVLTGVFIAAAADFSDKNLIILKEQARVAEFVTSMISIFEELDLAHSGKVSKDTFQKALADQDVQAYLSAHGLEPTHVQLIFDLLDEEEKGELDVAAFAMSMMRLKGDAKAIDARVIQRQVGFLHQYVKPLTQLQNVQTHRSIFTGISGLALRSAGARRS